MATMATVDPMATDPAIMHPTRIVAAAVDVVGAILHGDGNATGGTVVSRSRRRDGSGNITRASATAESHAQ
jgi:hypothetical protein